VGTPTNQNGSLFGNRMGIQLMDIDGKTSGDIMRMLVWHLIFSGISGIPPNLMTIIFPLKMAVVGGIAYFQTACGIFNTGFYGYDQV